MPAATEDAESSRSQGLYRLISSNVPVRERENVEESFILPPQIIGQPRAGRPQAFIASRRDNVAETEWARAHVVRAHDRHVVPYFA